MSPSPFSSINSPLFQREQPPPALPISYMGSPGTGTGTGTPCGACKFLRRKCASDCIFAPYFSNEHGVARFAAIHKVFGASNASKLLLHVPQHDRCEAAVAIAYEAQARLCDPVYGCVAHIFTLQQQVASLQAQLMQAKAQLARGMAGSRSMDQNQCQGNVCDPLPQPCNMYGPSFSPQSSRGCADNNSDGQSTPEVCFEDLSVQILNKRMTTHNELGELQALASRMMRN